MFEDAGSNDKMIMGVIKVKMIIEGMKMIEDDSWDDLRWVSDDDFVGEGKEKRKEGEYEEMDKNRLESK